MFAYEDCAEMTDSWKSNDTSSAQGLRLTQIKDQPELSNLIIYKHQNFSHWQIKKLTADLIHNFPRGKPEFWGHQ